ncbi:MAG: IS66 family transposase [Deltaproteobacteria bacterium]|nr:IS66 family transposase [Deltaproteobacteria bacterium]
MTDASASASHEVETLRKERDEYKKLYVDMLAHCRKLELGILGQKSERFISNEAQLTLSVLGTIVKPPDAPQPESIIPEHKRQKPTGRKPLPEHLPRVDIEIVPPEVEAQGTDAFEKIGEDVTETIERRAASTVAVRVHRGKYVAKDKAETVTSATVLQAPPPELPIPRGLAGPAFLADTIVRRWNDHLPLHRQERIFGREGLDIARSTICGWHAELMHLVTPLLNAMWDDALLSPYLCTDATGVLVQALEKCRHAHFFVVAAPEKHVLFFYSEKHNAAAVDEVLAGYKGYLVADAHSVYDHLYKRGDVVEVGCWAHARRYFFKALDSDPQRAREALALIGGLFHFERKWASAAPEARSAARATDAKPILDAFFAWCDDHAAAVLDHTPISRAIGYARNQREALARFLEDGRLPLHNNFSERALRREALGRKNWLFVGSDEGGDTNATFVSLLASCQLHDIEPFAYLRDLFCLLPSWPVDRVLDLAPLNWAATIAKPETIAKLAANPFRRASLGG